ncbi:MAG: site-2 protease family protein [Treponema sp.]|uniref:M50 family metallopeptidase n=1 Tax=Treponema sp. TaxID=166 RepID=UPI00298E069E|nr:M50 family metallopeptidase [Treponema sp.]MCR5385721.1 site-2 protease family protein [Treponema sp.]
MKYVIGLLCLNFIVFFHELGHFIFARIFGVKVLSFSIGMGPVILHKTIKGIDYRLSLLPIGGYCAMEGEKDFQKALEDGSPSVSKNPESLYGVHPLKRAMIAFAGPFFNFILAIMAFTVISMVGYTYYTTSNKIVIPDETIESPAREAGLLTGDKIIKINDTQIETFLDIQQQVAIRPKEELKVTVDRDGEILVFYITTLINKDQGNGVLGIMCDLNEQLKLEAPTYSFFPAIGQGFVETGKTISMTFKTLGILFKGVKLTNVVSGPARISSILGESVQEGFAANFRAGLYSILELISLISISLGIMNLLPIPVFDGGIILFALIEFIIKKEIPPKLQVKIQFIGIIIIALLIALSVSSDIFYFISQWRTSK